MPPADTSLARSAFLILLALADRPRHGLGIVEDVDTTSGGEIKLGPGTLYTSIHRLVDDGLIRETDVAPDPADHDSRRRYYKLTTRGERALKGEAAKLRMLVNAAGRRRLLEDA